jgi:uncharacterized protein YerC
VNKDMLDSVTEHLVCLKSAEEYEEFLLEILSPRELRMICNRYQIAALLNEGWDYRAIAHMLSVGVGTISRISLQVQLRRHLVNAV